MGRMKEHFYWLLEKMSFIEMDEAEIDIHQEFNKMEASNGKRNKNNNGKFQDKKSNKENNNKEYPYGKFSSRQNKP